MRGGVVISYLFKRLIQFVDKYGLRKLVFQVLRTNHTCEGLCTLHNMYRRYVRYIYIYMGESGCKWFPYCLDILILVISTNFLRLFLINQTKMEIKFKIRKLKGHDNRCMHGRLYLLMYNNLRIYLSCYFQSSIYFIQTKWIRQVI